MLNHILFQRPGDGREDNPTTMGQYVFSLDISGDELRGLIRDARQWPSSGLSSLHFPEISQTQARIRATSRTLGGEGKSPDEYDRGALYQLRAHRCLLRRCDRHLFVRGVVRLFKIILHWPPAERTDHQVLRGDFYRGDHGGTDRWTVVDQNIFTRVNL